MSTSCSFGFSLKGSPSFSGWSWIPIIALCGIWYVSTGADVRLEVGVIMRNRCRRGSQNKQTMRPVDLPPQLEGKLLRLRLYSGSFMQP